MELSENAFTHRQYPQTRYRTAHKLVNYLKALLDGSNIIHQCWMMMREKIKPIKILLVVNLLININVYLNIKHSNVVNSILWNYM